MRIAYLHYLYGRDTALHHVRQFTAAARGLGHDVAVHPMNLGPEASEGAGGGNGRARFRETLKRALGRFLHEPKELLWNLRYFPRERRLLAAARPDVLLVRSQVLTLSAIPVARSLGLPVVFEVNSPAEESRMYLHEYAHLPWVPEWSESWKLRHADAVTVVSSSLRDHLVTRYGVAPERITMVPNGADVDAFGPEVVPDPSLFHPEGVTVGFIGSFQPWHGVGLLATMIERVAAVRPAVRFVLVGDGPDVAPLREIAARLGDRVRWLGRVDHQRIPAIVAAFDIGVMPESNFYGSPLKVVEWMAAGRAVVAPRYGPLEDIIDHGTHGLLFPPGDVDALVGAVTRLVDDAGLRRTIAEAAATRARTSLTWRHNAERVVGACEAARRRRDEAAGANGLS